MALYFLFRFHESELVDSLDREFADDLDALDGASALSNEHTIEVYHANRFVARVKQGDEPLHVKDGPGPGRKAARPARSAAVTEGLLRAEQIVTEARSRVETAGALTQERRRQSDVTMGQSWEACRHSKKIIEHSNKTLARLSEKGSSSWEPKAPGRGRR